VTSERKKLLFFYISSNKEKRLKDLCHFGLIFKKRKCPQAAERFYAALVLFLAGKVTVIPHTDKNRAIPFKLKE